METCYANRLCFENIAASRRRAAIMYRLCGALMLALLVIVGAGCAENTRSRQIAALQAYHDLLEEQWQVDIATERDEVRRQIGEMRKEVESLAEKAIKAEQWMTERAQPALEVLKVAADKTARLMRGAPTSGTVLSFIEDRSRTDRDSLSRRIDETASRLNKSNVETADRLDSLGRELAKSARGQSTLNDEITEAARQLRSERRTAIENLRGEIPDTTALDAPVEKLLDDWGQSGRLASIETRERYLWPVVFGIVALVLVNLAIALRPRYSKQGADAVRKADAAEQTAKLAQTAAKRAEKAIEAFRKTAPKADNPPAGTEPPSDT